MNKSHINLAIYEAAERVLGETRSYKLHRRLAINRLQKADCIFIHIPKAAGTSIATTVIGKRAGHYPAGELKKTMGEQAFNQLFSFAVTRHPFDRLVSAYHYARQGGGSHGAIRHDPAYASDLFRSFDSFVQEWLIYQNLSEVDYVFRPQEHFVYDNGRCLVDYVGQVENLSDVEQRLSQTLGRSIVIPKRNTTGSNIGRSKSLSRETLHQIQALYDADLKQFGYTMLA